MSTHIVLCAILSNVQFILSLPLMAIISYKQALFPAYSIVSNEKPDAGL